MFNVRRDSFILCFKPFYPGTFTDLIHAPRSHPELAFATGDGLKILAAGNGDATNHVTRWQAKAMPAYNGKCLVIVRGKGALTVKSKGFEDTVVNIK